MYSRRLLFRLIGCGWFRSADWGQRQLLSALKLVGGRPRRLSDIAMFRLAEDSGPSLIGRRNS